MILSLEKSLYSAECINRAAYHVAQLGSTRILESLSTWEVELIPIAPEECEILLHEFQINLSDEYLREIIRGRTENLRSLILAHAYSNTRLINEDIAT